MILLLVVRVLTSLRRTLDADELVKKTIASVREEKRKLQEEKERKLQKKRKTPTFWSLSACSLNALDVSLHRRARRVRQGSS